MNQLPLPGHFRAQVSEHFQASIRTPQATLEKAYASCTSGDFERFRDILLSQSSSSDGLAICDFHEVMMEAIKRGEGRFIKELLDHALPMDSLYALEAVMAKEKEALEIFIRYGWDINQPTGELSPPVLGYAVADEDMVAWLLDRGADPNQQCVIDLTPLSLAVKSASMSVIQLMIDCGGDVRKGQLLHHAIDRDSDNIAVLRLLLERGAPINSVMYEEHHSSWALFSFMPLGTPLHTAVQLGKVAVAHYLVREGASVTIKDVQGRTALEYARIFNQREIIRVLDEQM